MVYGYVNNAVKLSQLDPEQLSYVFQDTVYTLNSIIEDNNDRTLYRAITGVLTEGHDSVFVPALPTSDMNDFETRRLARLSTYQLLLTASQGLTMRPGDILITSTLVNFSRDLYNILLMLSGFSGIGVRVISLRENFDSASESNEALMRALPAMGMIQLSIHTEKAAQIKNNRERAAERGVEMGRKAFSISDFPEFPKLYSQYMAREMSKTQFADAMKISRPTLDKLIAEFEKGARRK